MGNSRQFLQFMWLNVLENLDIFLFIKLSCLESPLCWGQPSLVWRKVGAYSKTLVFLLTFCSDSLHSWLSPSPAPRLTGSFSAVFVGVVLQTIFIYLQQCYAEQGGEGPASS